MTEEFTKIGGHKKVIEVFSCWPSFHDAEVVWMNLHREKGSGLIGPVIKVALQIKEPLKNEFFLVELAFLGASKILLNHFNYQNAINGLFITTSISNLSHSEIFDVEFCQGQGVDCSFECYAIEVVSVNNFVPPKSYW